ncbi:hypothetical protein HKX48_007938 [Thoreauomyces humboldtii]|nr:hypothetical protein HKX48_007938 [Thoreauomyces humboldtii]
MSEYTIISPVNGKAHATVKLSSEAQAKEAVGRAAAAFPKWRATPLATRIQLVAKFVDAFVARKDELAEELSWLMGRPKSQTPGEIRGFEERARHMISIAEGSLKDVPALPKKDGFHRFIRREPLGLVFVIAAWNYPYLIAVNGVVPALLAGNTVILKQAPQTFPCAERFGAAFEEAGLPTGVFQFLHVDHDVAASIIRNPSVAHVLFTGSVRGGREVAKIAAERFIGVGLELGGKDAAYVRRDADVDNAAENLVDGAMFNSGQSCCGIERVYVHEEIHDALVQKMVEVAKAYKLGDPLSSDTNLGPLVRTESADLVRAHVKDAREFIGAAQNQRCTRLPAADVSFSVSKGAKAHLEETSFTASKIGTPYLAPQILTDVTHSMRVMTEESFGPVVGIMRVRDDAHALSLINDSDFGLTASIWTKDAKVAAELADEIQTGTVFLNRCDYLDPALPWTGVKDSGRGVTLSAIGYDAGRWCGKGLEIRPSDAAQELPL